MYKISNSPLKKNLLSALRGQLPMDLKHRRRFQPARWSALQLIGKKMTFLLQHLFVIICLQPGLHRMTVIAHAIILDSSNNHLHAGQNGGTFKITILKRSTDLKLNPGTPLSLIAYLCVVHNLVFLKSN